MSQQPSNDLEVSEGSQHPCQCSAISSMESVLAQRDRIERGLGSTRIPNSQDHVRGLESLQNAFEPIRTVENPSAVHDGQQESSRNVEILEQSVQPRSGDNQILTRHGHGLSCSPRNLDLSRNLAFEAARRVQESSGCQDPQHSLTSSPSPLLEPGPGLLEAKELDKQLAEEHGKSSSKEKTKNMQQILNPYQHHRDPSHFLPESHPPHVHKHSENLHKHQDAYKATSGLDGTEGIMGFRQHTHHHHGNAKVSHHHVGQGVPGGHHHHHGNLTGSGSLGGHIHGNPGSLNNGTTGPGVMIHGGSPSLHTHGVVSSPNVNNHHASTPSFSESTGYHHGPGAVSGTSSNSSLINHGNSPTGHHHANVNSTLSATPLIAHHHGSSSGSLTGHSSGNHHHLSSGISCESSSSNANTRTHSRLDHVYDHHHHLHPHVSDIRQRAPSSLDHHTHHHSHVHSHAHAHSQPSDIKNVALIGINSIQVSPGKSKCQCHVVQQTTGNKRAGGDGENDGGVELTSRTHQPPALPPRPPPRPTRHFETAAPDHRHTGESGCCKKYIILCFLCGGLNVGIGSFFLAVHVVLSAHTASLALFETVPSYIPGTMLILMGIFTMLLARRKHRYGLLMKVCGSVSVVCALVCVLVTVTTTVVHMSRLQGLRECVYTARARSCTCYGAPQARGDPGVLFEGTPHCEAVHGALYSCLRALFGISVAGILACIFSCMLVYQLLSHEKKKMYWEQLELRCRSLYGQGGPAGPTAGSCGCCNDCGGASPWWAQTPGNLYTPNPDLAPSRRWRLPWSRSRGPAPSPDSNYGFHTQARQTETNPDSATGPYSVLNAQSGGPYSVLNAQNGPYTPSRASYSVLETPVPLWGPPPPYSDPNSPARRPQVPESRPRIAKRLDNFEGNDDHRPRVTKRSSDNYENAEEISNSTDPEGGNEGTMKGRRIRKPLKGVENGAFQQEPNPAPKQSESELYFGDVSSCCGPESSFYDLAVDKEGAENPEGVDYIAARLGKRQLSKRSRLPLPLPTDSADVPSDSYANSEEPRNARGPFLAPDAQYEVIQQGRYAYYASQADEDLQEVQASSAYFREDDNDRNRERDYRDYRGNPEEETPQCCLSDATTLDSGWQSGEQQQSDDNVRPVNV
ncbi:uncharacterized protein LOC107265957 [Cephus cinctus]|uniref:Uncharacterized protein LOC107265957 n=1 Tax=Cephus cinctus TaxID=211228 RepID=A0AAJ7BQY7_CEPCN|nr:uncharacterized protein LOC107265957 [Cephus cinctus]XP_015591417.1 uncharacterized protein LOC107265957 [Cephus cinctus]